MVFLYLYTERTREILDHGTFREFYFSATYAFWAQISRFRGNKPRPIVATLYYYFFIYILFLFIQLVFSERKMYEMIWNF